MNRFLKFLFIVFLTQNINAQDIQKIELPTQKKETSDFVNSIKEPLPLSLEYQMYDFLTAPKYHDISKTKFISTSSDKPMFSFFQTSSDNNWGFEGAYTAGFGINWHLRDNLTLTGSPFLSSYFFGPMDYSRNLSAGLNLMLTYQPTDWLTLRAYGQYAYNGLSSPYTSSLIAPQNSFGGEVHIKFSETFGIGGGVKYINARGNWKPQFYTTPLINIDGSKFLNKN